MRDGLDGFGGQRRWRVRECVAVLTALDRAHDGDPDGGAHLAGRVVLGGRDALLVVGERPDDQTTVTRPQARRSRAAILDAVVAIIQDEGAASVTHQRVAERARVGRATVYRHCPEHNDLLYDALEMTTLSFLDAGPGSLEERIRADMVLVAGELNTVSVIRFAATIIERAQWDDRARALRDRLVAETVGNIEVALADAVASGVLQRAPAASDLFDALLGPLWSRRLLQGGEITPELVDRTIGAALWQWIRAT